MISLIFAAILGASYVYLRRKDPRMLRNGIVLVAACWFAFVGTADILARWFPWFDWVVLAAIALTPLAIVVLAGFLIANGVTMLRREGRSLGNLLSLIAGLALLALPVAAFALVLTLNSVAIGVAALMFLLCSYFGVVFVVFLSYAAVYGKMRHSITHPPLSSLAPRSSTGRYRRYCVPVWTRAWRSTVRLRPNQRRC